MARHQENLIESLNKKEKAQGNRSLTTSYSAQTTRVPNSSVGNQSNKLFETRRAQGLCYKCGEKYHPGHQCKQRQLNAISATTDQEANEPGEAGIE